MSNRGLEGRFLEAGTRVAVPGAIVRVGSVETTTDADGNFWLDLEDGYHLITAGLPGRHATSVKVRVFAGAIHEE